MKTHTEAPDKETREYAKELRILEKEALKLGADDAVVLPADAVITDPRVRFKCMVPRCYMSGECAHCPPHGYSLDHVKEVVESHRWGVFFRVKVPGSVIAAKDIAKSINSGIMDPYGHTMNLGAHYILVFTITKLLQQKAVDLGMKTGAGFAAGNCRDALCHLRPVCRRLSGGPCRHPGLSSPSMESCGMDAFRMAAEAGWDIYPIGGTCTPKSVPRGNLMGLVMVAGPGDYVCPLDGATEKELSLPKHGAKKTGLKRMQRKTHLLKQSILAMQETNITLLQIPFLAMKGGVWTRLFLNLRKLEGGTMGALKRNRIMFTGRPGRGKTKTGG